MEQLKVQVWIFHGSAGADDALRVLLLKLVPARGGFWQPVTGGVEKGEEPIDAARREAVEESGLSFAGAPFELGYQFAYDGTGARAGAKFREVCFGFAVDPSLGVAERVRLDSHEHVESRWMRPSEARGMLRFDSNVAGLDALLRKIATGA